MPISNEKKKTLNGLMSKLNKKFGEGTVSTVGAIKDRLVVKRIPTPSLEFNDMLYGGLARGRIIEFFGPNSSGKTSMAIEIIAKYQRENPDVICGWLETENSVDIEALERHGVDAERLIYWDQSDVGTAEEALELYRSIVSSGMVNLLVVNSIAGLAPQSEVEENIGKQGMALVARLLSKLFRIVTGPGYKNDVTQIFINQVRATMDQYKPESTSGGQALGFYASQRIRFSKKKLQKEDPLTVDEGVKIGCIVYKNRCADGKNPMLTCEYYARYNSGIDAEVNLPMFLQQAGIVRQSGAWWYYEDENGNPYTIGGRECKFRSKNDFLDSLRTNKVLHDELVDKLNGKTATVVSQEEAKEIEDQEKLIQESAIEFLKEQIGEDESSKLIEGESEGN